MDFEIKSINKQLVALYGDDTATLGYQQKRYENLINLFCTKFNQKDFHLFSAPGRTEISGNHTDHNNGLVLASSINLDTIAVANTNNQDFIQINSVGFDTTFKVHLKSLEPVEEEIGTTAALIRGIAARLKQLGFHIGGFNAYISSDVLIGSGLSSSASVEVLIGSIFNTFFNEGKIDSHTIAKSGQFAENVFFGKPCGLMDQMACAVGGIISIDFKNPLKPVVKKIPYNFYKKKYNLLIVNTGGNHADLTDAYASIPKEMYLVAEVLGEKNLRHTSKQKLFKNVADLRKKTGDRAVLRAIHFFEENERVLKQTDALLNNDLEKFLQLVNESGSSSFKWLQNIFSNGNPHEQGISLALALTEDFLKQGVKGACRIHGGGFAGTVLVFLPAAKVSAYSNLMNQIFGSGSVINLTIRDVGCSQIL